MQDRLFLVIAAIIISLAVISWSFQHGRLQYQMDYEDIITHIDGLKRLTDLSEGGGGVYLANYLKMPPHAPLHSMMASIGFIIFGVKDWAPYAVNALVLFAFLALVQRETRSLGSWPSWLAVLGAIFVPVSFESIHEFRPDFPCALATLWGMVLYPRLRDQEFCIKAALSGLAFGLALLAKPPFFPYTLAMGGWPWLMVVVAGARDKKSIKGIWILIFKSWPFFAGAALVAGPHYLVAWQRILGYIQQNQFGADAHVWKMKGGIGYQLVYHLFGAGGQFMLGKGVVILIGLAATGLILSFLRRRNDQENSGRFLRLFGFMAWAWLLIAVNPHENPFFGLTFQYGLVLVAMFSLAWFFSIASTAEWPLKAATGVPLAVVLAIFYLGIPLPEYSQNVGFASDTNLNPAEIKEFTRMLPVRVYEIIKKYRPYSDSGYTLLSSYGIVSSHRLQWLADKGKQDFTVFAVPFVPLEQLLSMFRQDPNQIHHVDFVIVTEANAEGVFEHLPNAKTSEGLLEWIREQHSYSCVETVKTPSGKKYCIFMALPNFSIFSSMEGLAPKSKPLEIAGHPVVIPATSGKVALDYDSPVSGIGKMELSMRGTRQQLMIQASNNGKMQLEYAVSLSDQISDKQFPIQLGKGMNHLEILLTDRNKNIITNPALCFTKLRITPRGDASPMEDILRKERQGCR